MMARFLRSSLSWKDISAPFMSLFNLVMKLYSIHEQSPGKPFSNVILYIVSYKFPVYEFHECLVFKWITVIHIARGNHELQELSTLIAYQMHLEAEESSHGTSYCYYPLTPAYPQREAVDESDACAFAQKHLLDEYGKRNGHFFFQLHKTVKGNDLGKEMAHVPEGLFLIEMLKATVA